MARKPNWTEKEKLTLVEAVRVREERLFGKFKGSGAIKNNKIKETAWEEVLTAVNAKSDTIQRTVEEVKKQYANIKQRTKEKADAIRRPVTGGGPKPPSPSPVETELLNHLEDRPTFCGLLSGHDTEEVILGLPSQDSTQSVMNSCTLGNTSSSTLGNTSSSSLTLNDAPCSTIELEIPNTSSIIDLQVPTFSSSTKTTKRRKTMEEEEILTLRAEREKYAAETKKLREEAEYYKTKTIYLKLKIKNINVSNNESEM